MNFLTQRTLKVFAVLEEIRSGSKNILDGLMPFFAPLLNEIEGNVFCPVAFSESVTTAYGWNFNSDVVEELIPQFLTKGWLERFAGDSRTEAFRVAHISELDAATATASVSAKLDNIVDDFFSFISKISPLSQFSISKAEFPDILVEWLVSIDAYNEQVLHKSAIAKITEGKLSVYQELPDGANLKSEERYLCARYVKHLFDVKSPYTDDLCSIAAVGLLTEVVRDFQKPVTSVATSDLTIYLDSSVALELLGVSGSQACENVQGVVSGALGIGCQVRVFESTMAEMQRALDAVLRRPIPNRTGPTADALRKREVLEAYVREVARSPRTFLERAGIRVTQRKLSQFPAEFEHFTNDLYEALVSRISWHQEIEPKAHDASAAALIMRMRRSATSSDIFRSKFVFVTRNGMLAQLARKFCIEEEILGRSALPPIIHQRQLAAALWLRTGNGVSSIELPRHLLLAACEQVLSINRAVVEKVQYHARSLTKETALQLDLLLSQDRSVQLLQDKTLNTSKVINADNIEELIDVMRGGLSEEIKAQSDAVIAAEKKSAERKIREAGKKRTQAEAERDAAQSALDSMLAEDKRVIGALLSAENRRARAERYSLFGAIALLSIFSAGFSFFTSVFVSPWKEILTFLAITLTALSMLLPILGVDFGLNAAFEKRARKNLKKAAFRAGLSDKLQRFEILWDASSRRLSVDVGQSQNGNPTVQATSKDLLQLITRDNSQLS